MWPGICVLALYTLACNVCLFFSSSVMRILSELLLVDDLDAFDMKDGAGDGSTAGYVMNRDPLADSAVAIISGSAVGCLVVK